MCWCLFDIVTLVHGYEQDKNSNIFPLLQFHLSVVTDKQKVVLFSYVAFTECIGERSF